MDATLNGFSGEKYTLGAFIDLSLLGKLNIYSIKVKSLSWYMSYLSDGKNLVGKVGKEMTSLQDITCGVPLDLDLGCLLFLLYINHFFKAFSIITPMFADDTIFLLIQQK